ncbi:hypothetical protein SBRY_90283 [Actinacidiphila bryophytorum]|uniref:Uncharacterized protein n=1 Tax=Actinacidiphila bryophytorum TaxID=1436133 RepID=A0A9W4MKL4_9ACTN|nr:hypothetical protein SBRY_90283 [Actinacidiphila bryophytorum]
MHGGLRRPPGGEREVRARREDRHPLQPGYPPPGHRRPRQNHPRGQRLMRCGAAVRPVTASAEGLGHGAGAAAVRGGFHRGSGVGGGRRSGAGGRGRRGDGLSRSGQRGGIHRGFRCQDRLLQDHLGLRARGDGLPGRRIRLGRGAERHLRQSGHVGGVCAGRGVRPRVGGDRPRGSCGRVGRVGLGALDRPADGRHSGAGHLRDRDTGADVQQPGAPAGLLVGGVVRIGDAAAAPAGGDAAGGGALYAAGGALMWRGSNGTVTRIAPA